MKTLWIQNNLCALDRYHSEFERLVYIPKFWTKLQRENCERIFSELKNQYPKIEWAESMPMGRIGTESDDRVLAWNAVYEKQAFGGKLLNYQNRLFHALDFQIPEGFTAFRKKAEERLPRIFQDTWAPIGTEALTAVETYFASTRPSIYFDTRNGLLNREDATGFSPHLANGTLDVRYLYNQVRNYEATNGANKSTYWIVFELLWREFFYWHYQKHHIKYFSLNGLKGQIKFCGQTPPSYEELLEKSPNEFFRACVRQLFHEGHLSNRARQIFASQWAHMGEWSWLCGARLFEERLIDYDVYSNYGNWMYLAGVGVDPRGKRKFNVEKQLQNYDPDGTYLKKWGDKNAG